MMNLKSLTDEAGSVYEAVARMAAKEQQYRRFICDLINGYDGKMDLREIVGRCCDLGFTIEPKLVPIKPNKTAKK